MHEGGECPHVRFECNQEKNYYFFCTHSVYFFKLSRMCDDAVDKTSDVTLRRDALRMWHRGAAERLWMWHATASLMRPWRGNPDAANAKAYAEALRAARRGRDNVLRRVALDDWASPSILPDAYRNYYSAVWSAKATHEEVPAPVAWLATQWLRWGPLRECMRREDTEMACDLPPPM